MLKKTLASMVGELTEICFNHGVKLTQKLAELTTDVAIGDNLPTDQASEVYQYLTQKIEQEIAAFDEILNGDLAEFNAMLQQYKINVIA